MYIITKNLIPNPNKKTSKYFNFELSKITAKYSYYFFKYLSNIGFN